MANKIYPKELQETKDQYVIVDVRKPMNGKKKASISHLDN